MKYRRILSILVVVALLSLLFNCRMDAGFGPAATAGLPADKVLDVARSYSGPFAYETLLPVSLNLTVELYRQPTPAAALERQAIGSQLIVVTLRDSQGQALYSGSVPSGGTLATVLPLPAAPQKAVLRLEAPGYQTREVTIDGMVLHSEVNRVMGLLSEGPSAKGELLPDTDKDGVPDIYDVDPLDPEVAFQVRTPASGQYTVAFEDLYPVPGDADYNDFVAKYFIKENYKSEIPKEDVLEMMEEQNPKPIEVMLHNLHGESTAVSKLAGYSHKFGIVIDFPGHVAMCVKRVYYDANGNQRVDSQNNVADRAVIWLFENTSKPVLGKTATFDILFPKGITRNMVSIAPYDPVLYVHNTGMDIHLVGHDSLSGQELSYMDPNGYPWALLVPEDWQPPAETQYIGKAYPLFDEWRASKGAVAPYWYLYPASIGTKPGNQAPSQVSSPDSPQMTAGSASEQLFHLLSTDPEGDKVTFLSSPAPMALDRFFSLDSEKGVVRFAPQVPEGDFLFYFWSVDAWGASNIDKPYKVTFVFRKKSSENLPPTASFNDLQASDGGSPEANGFYRENGSNQGRPKYDQVGGSSFLYFLLASDLGNSPYWSIQTAVDTTVLDALYYNGNSTALTAPEGDWSLVTGAEPAPAVSRVAITGTLAVGETLTGHYVYTDPDGDAEGATTLQWYRFAAETDTSGGTVCEGIGADTSAYTIHSSDLSQFLRLQVTPVDALGLAGTPVLSGAVDMIL